MQSKRPQTFVTNIKCKEVFYIIHNTKQWKKHPSSVNLFKHKELSISFILVSKQSI